MKPMPLLFAVLLLSTSIFSVSASDGSHQLTPLSQNLEGKYTAGDDALEIKSGGKCIYEEWAEKGPLKLNCTWVREGDTITLKLRNREEKAKLIIESRRGKKYIVLALKFLANGDAVGYTSEPLK